MSRRVVRVALGLLLVIAGALWALFFGVVLLTALALGVDESWLSAGGVLLVGGAMLLGVGAVYLGVKLTRSRPGPVDEST